MKCPICKEEINKLERIVSGTTYYDFYLDADGNVQHETLFILPDDRISNFECTECGEILFHKESEAIAFLKGE